MHSLTPRDQLLITIWVLSANQFGGHSQYDTSLWQHPLQRQFLVEYAFTIGNLVFAVHFTACIRI